MLTFAYRPPKEKGGGPVPALDVVVRNNQKSISIENCLVDTGADHNFLNLSVAKELNLDLKGADTCNVPQRNDADGKIVKVKYVLDNHEWIGETVFVDTEEPIALLGMIGFFDAFDVCFSHSKQSFHLTPTKAKKIDMLR